MTTHTSNQKQEMLHKMAVATERKMAEANARRKVAKSWAYVACGTAYKKAAVKNFGEELAQKIEDELFDGIFLTLKERHDEKSYRVRKRMLRRIVEKRQAQKNHRCVGRTTDRLASYLQRKTAGTCMRRIHKYQQCA